MCIYTFTQNDLSNSNTNCFAFIALKYLLPRCHTLRTFRFILKQHHSIGEAHCCSRPTCSNTLPHTARGDLVMVEAVTTPDQRRTIQQRPVNIPAECRLPDGPYPRSQTVTNNPRDSDTRAHGYTDTQTHHHTVSHTTIQSFTPPHRPTYHHTVRDTAKQSAMPPYYLPNRHTSITLPYRPPNRRHTVRHTAIPTATPPYLPHTAKLPLNHITLVCRYTAIATITTTEIAQKVSEVYSYFIIG